MVTYPDKTKDHYRKVSVPNEMVREIERIIENDKGLGFVSIQEFVKEAVRRSIILYRGANIEES
jgi:Arc/MetJ-type ribon-helix-helix transcriptional regulator